jgi:hypothetical protein
VAYSIPVVLESIPIKLVITKINLPRTNVRICPIAVSTSGVFTRMVDNSDFSSSTKPLPENILVSLSSESGLDEDAMGKREKLIQFLRNNQQKRPQQPTYPSTKPDLFLSTTAGRSTQQLFSAPESSTGFDYTRVQHPVAFPFKLHYMLEDVERSGNAHIVSWMPSGRSFRVHSTPSEFVRQVVPLYFKMTKYKSFKRQLVNYGFTRIEQSGEFKGKKN